MSDSFGSIILLISVLVAFGAGFFLMLKMNQVKELEISVKNLRQTLDEMEEQAKLVVRTDIELNKAQEELDKKISGLYTLQRLSRIISSTLEESQVFKQIDHTAIESLGFKNCLVYLWEESRKIFKPYLALGYTEQELLFISETINTSTSSYHELIDNSRTLSSLSLAKDTTQKNMFSRIFKTDSFIFCPLVPKDGYPGFMVLGANKQALLNESDVELVKILAHQISQALENARLFEKTWQAQQALEKRVEERTRELSQALEEVKHISQRKNDFVSNVSH